MRPLEQRSYDFPHIIEREYDQPTVDIAVQYPYYCVTSTEVETWDMHIPGNRTVSEGYFSEKLGIEKTFVAAAHQSPELMWSLYYPGCANFEDVVMFFQLQLAVHLLRCIPDSGHKDTAS